jgi:hypothetical protein
MRAARRAVVGHPCGEQGGLGDRGEQGAAHCLGVAAAQQSLAIGAQVLDQRLARVPAAEPVIQLPEHRDRGPEPLDVAHADPDTSERVLACARSLAGVDQPVQRGLVPCHRADQPALERVRVVQVGPPQHRYVPRRLRRRAGVPQASVQIWRLPRMRQADSRRARRVSGESQRLTRRRRQAQAIGESLER